MGLTLGRRAEGGQGQSQEKWRAESGGRTLGGPRRAMAEGGGQRERSFYFVLVSAAKMHLMS